MTDKNLEERRKYVTAFNSTMVKIWREQINLLGVIDTGALYRSTMAVRMTADGKFTQITLAQSFNTYGIFVDYGTGSICLILKKLLQIYRMKYIMSLRVIKE